MANENHSPWPDNFAGVLLFIAATFFVLLHVIAALLPQFAVFALPFLLLETVAAVIFIIAAFVEAARREKMLLQVTLLAYGLVIFLCWSKIRISRTMVTYPCIGVLWHKYFPAAGNRRFFCNVFCFGGNS